MPHQDLIEIPSVSTEYVRFAVKQLIGDTEQDPTSATVSFAFVGRGVEPTTEWFAGDWEPTSAAPWFARALVGPGAQVIAEGLYDVWIRIATGTETVARKVGVARIT